MKKGQPKTLRISLVAASLFLFCALCIEPTLHVQANDKIAAPNVGDRAPDFTLQDFNGKAFAFSERIKGKGILLWFTNLCGGCQAEIPKLLRLGSEYDAKGIEIVAVSVLGEDRKTAEAVMRKDKIVFPVLYDPKGEVTELYAGKYVPATCPLTNIYIVQKSGKIVFASHLPGTDEKELSRQLEKITKEAGK